VVPLEHENDFYRKHNLGGKFVVLFSGNHGYIAALESIIEAAELLRDQSDILFLFAGEGSVKKDLINLKQEKGLDNVRFLSTLPRDEWLEMMAASDLGLVTLRRDLAELNVPSKVYTLMSAARPILASVPVGSEVAKIIEEANCGFIAPPQDPSGLANQILECREIREELDSMGVQGRKYLLTHLNRKGQTKRYMELIQNSVSKDKRL
jgi:colanic acid biosynthesis glycosyl transferase WcaI